MIAPGVDGDFRVAKCGSEGAFIALSGPMAASITWFGLTPVASQALWTGRFVSFIFVLAFVVVWFLSTESHGFGVEDTRFL